MSSRRQLFNQSKETLECNIALVGELGVGKSALTVKYLTRRFIMEYDPAIEDTYQKNETIDNQDIQVKIMDTYDSDEKNPDRYFKWAHGIVVVYSITDRHTFNIARKFLDHLNQYEKCANKSLPVILVGNKLDLERYRTISKTAGQELATEYDCRFHETSAAEDFHSVEQLFHDLIRDISSTDVSQPPLYISEDSKVASGLGGRTFRRTKSPGNSDSVKDSNSSGRNLQDKVRFQQRRMPSTFKIFKSRFNIFN